MAIGRRTFLEAILAAPAAPSAFTATGAAWQAREGKTAPRIIALDVNETLLDVSSLRPQFARIFKNADVVTEWFTNVLFYSQVATIAGPYATFGDIARASLQMTAASHGVKLAAPDETAILKGLVTLPAHADVRAGLEKLRNAGFRMITLTNSAPAAVEQQVKNAGISDFFERRISVDSVRVFKPAPQVYQYAAKEMGVEPSQLRVVAAHAWDVLGAMRAGCAAAFIARPTKVLYPPAEKPDIIGRDLVVVAEEIIKKDSPK